jgi:tetratricopeptide (TPR) repeat protein
MRQHGESRHGDRVRMPVLLMLFTAGCAVLSAAPQRSRVGLSAADYVKQVPGDCVSRNELTADGAHFTSCNNGQPTDWGYQTKYQIVVFKDAKYAFTNDLFDADKVSLDTICGAIRKQLGQASEHVAGGVHTWPASAGTTITARERSGWVSVASGDDKVCQEYLDRDTSGHEAQSAALTQDVATEVARAEQIVTQALTQLGNADLVAAAIPKAEYALNVRVAHQGEGWWQTIDAKHSLAVLRTIAGLNEQQRSKMVAAVSQYDQILTLYRQGRYQDALALAPAVCDAYRQIFGENDPLYAGSLSTVAELYRSLGQFDKAEPYFQQAATIRKTALGAMHPDYATSLTNLGYLYESTGRYSEAESLLREAVRIDATALGEGSAGYAFDLGALAGLFLVTGRYKEAEPLLVQALEIQKRTLGEENTEYAANASNLGSLYYSMGRYDQAEPLMRQATELAKKLYGEQHPYYARALNNLAALYKSMGRYDQAEPLYRQAIEIYGKTQGEDHPDYATGLNNLGLLYYEMGKYDSAESLYLKAIEALKKSVGGRHPTYALALNNLAGLYEAMGRYEDAEPLCRRAMEIRKAALGESNPDYAASLNNLALLYGKMGRYQQEEPLLLEASRIVKEVFGEQHPTYAASLNNLAGLYDALGQYDRAEPLYRQAVEIYKAAVGTDHPEYATGLDNLAFAEKKLGRYDQAEPLYREAIEIRKKTLGESHPDYALSLSHLAALDYAMGHLPEAESLARQAVEIDKRALGAEHPDYANRLYDLGDVLAAMKRPAEAAPVLIESAQVEWTHLTRNFPTMSDEQKKQFLAKNSFSQTELLSGLALQGNGVEARAGLQGVLLSKQLLFEAARQEAGALRATVAHASPEWRASWREWEQERRDYATLALASTSTASDRPRADRKPADTSRLRSLAAEIEQREQDLRQKNPTYAMQAKLQQVTLDDVKRALRAGEALIEYVVYRPYDYSKRDWTSAHYGAFVLAGGSSTVSATDLGDAAAIDRAVAEFRLGVRAFIDDADAGLEPSPAKIRRSEGQIAESSSKVRGLVWQPLEKQLAGVRRVYLAPDGSLSLIPFDALAREDGSGGWHYLVEDHELIYLGTGRDLGRLALGETAVATQPKTAVLIGDPDFDETPVEVAAVIAGMSSPATTILAQAGTRTSPSTLGAAAGGGALRLDVPHTWQQVAALDQLLDEAGKQLKRLGWSVTTWKDRAAVEEAAEGVAAPRILQFATHGYIMDRPKNPTGWDNPLLRSMLIMAGANHVMQTSPAFYEAGGKVLTEAQARARGMSDQQMEAARITVGDGILTAYEVTGMNLQGTDLVNLTACETGLGEVTPDGVAGLRQAFLMAGARSITVSMWEVPADETTAQIGDFYDRWLGGAKTVTRYEAFHAAQLAALARARQNHGSGHPFYWAGVVYVGDPGDLPVTAAAQAGTGKQGSHE